MIPRQVAMAGMGVPKVSVLRFGVFELDRRTGELRKAGMLVHLPPQPFKVLALLASDPGQLVTREEICQQLWESETFVDFEQGLNHCIKQIRTVLGDDAETPRYIETLPRRGYRFIAPVDVAPPSPVASGAAMSSLPTPAPASLPGAAGDAGATALTVGADPVPALPRDGAAPAQGRPRGAPLRRRWIIAAIGGAAVAITVALLALNVWGLRGRLATIVAERHPALCQGCHDAPHLVVPLPRIESIAVLPLENLSHDPNQEYFADGMTEALITDLGKISALRVISRQSVMRYKGSKKTLPEIARELNVDAVVEGTVQRAGNRMRITANLLHAPSDRHLWAETYERDLRDVLTLQGEVAQAIAREVQVKLTPQEQARLTRARPVNPEAYQLYSRARSIMNRYQGPTEAMVKYLEEAIAKDPKFALAQADLGVVYLASGRRAEAASAIMKALELDDTLSEAHTAMADLKCGDWEWSECERESRRAIELNPSNVDAHHDYSHFLQAMGRFPESLTESLRALELNPLSVPMNCHLGEHYLAARQYDQAIAQLRKALELEPNFPQAHYFLGAAYLAKGMLSEAIEEDLRAAVLWGKSAEDVAALRKAFSSFGLKGYRQKQLEFAKAQWQKSRDNEFELASLYALLGNKESALDWLQKAVEKRHVDVPDLRTDPSFDPLRSDPRFQDLLRRMNFPS